MQAQPTKSNKNNLMFADSLLNAERAVMALTAQGILVSNINLCQPGKPTIQVEYTPALARFINDKIAVYYAFGHKQYGKYKQAQYPLHGCRVVWIEYTH
ncbi:hypothetical protein [Limnobaculum xujianqingii]|uniref:hypothetical protein n=1 Tax=Limnobaculum xujianqingii TaxID=2738837 RepID=UPI001125DF06|nr:hypothetical protein [Limnobaculum xujianqingii]